MISRMLNGCGFVLVCGLMAGAVFLQNSAGIIPCPLCMMQRYTFALLAGVFFIGFIWRWQRCANKLLSFLAMMICLAGATLAGRQVWLQHYPPQQTGECSLSLDYLWQTLPWQEVLRKIFEGGTECAESTWALWSLSIAEWSLLAFIGFFCLAMYQFIASKDLP